MNKFFLTLFILIFCVILTSVLFLCHPTLRAKLVYVALRTAGYSFSASTTEIKYNGGIRFKAFDLKLGSDNGLFDAKVDEISLTLKILPLLMGKIRPSAVIAHSPEVKIALSKNKDSSDNFFDKSIFPKHFFSLLPKLVEVDNGSLVIENSSIQIKDIFVRGTPTHIKGRSDIKAIANFNNNRVAIPFSVSGYIRNSLIHSDCFLDISSGDFFPIAWIPGLESVCGSIAPNISASLEAKNRLSLKGSFSFKNFSIEIDQKLEDNRYRIQDGQIIFAANFSSKILALNFISVETPEVNVVGTGEINFLNLTDPMITLNITSNPVDIEIFKKYIPVQLLDSWLRTELIPSFISGTASLTHLGFKGSANQILNIDKEENAAVFSFEIKVINAKIKQKELPWEFKDVSGSVRLVNGILKVDLETANISGTNNGSSLKNCIFIMDSVYKDDPLINFIVDGAFAVTDIIKLSTTIFTPKALRHIFSHLIFTKGMLEITDPFIVSVQGWDDSSVNITKGTAALKDCIFKLKDSTENKTIIINAILQEKNDGLNISSITAFVEDTILIKNGSFYIDNSFSGLFSIAGETSLKDIPFFAKLGKIQGNYIKILSESFSFDGIINFKLNAEVKENGVFNVVLFEATNSNDPIEVDFKYSNTELNLKLIKLGLVFNSSKGGTISVNGLMKDSSFEFNGNINTDLELSGMLSGMIDWLNFSDVLGLSKDPLTIEGINPFKVDLKGKADEWRLRGNIGMDGLQGTYNSLFFGPLSDNEQINFETVIQNGKVTKNEIKLSSGSSICDIEIKKFPGNNVFSWIFSSKGFDITGLRLRHGFTVDGYGSGNVSGNIVVNSGTTMNHTAIDGFISCNNIFFPTEMYLYPVSNGNGHFSFSKDSISFDSVQLEIASSKLNADGIFLWSDGFSGHVNIFTPILSVSDLIPDHLINKQQNKDTQSVFTFTKNININFAINADSVLWDDIKIKNVKIKGVFEEDMISVTEGYGLLSHSKISSAGKYSILTNKIDMSGSVFINSQPISMLLESLGLDPFISGDLSAELIFEVNDAPVNEIPKNINGTWKLHAENGTFEKSSIIFSILRIISIKDIFYKDQGDGFVFRSINGAGTITQGVMYSEEIVMLSPVFNSVLNKATLNLDSQEIKGSIFVSPLGTLDSIISKIPLVGYILGGENNTLMILNFDLDGIVTDPVVTYRPFTGYPSSLLGYFKRLFAAPGKLIDDLSNR